MRVLQRRDNLFHHFRRACRRRFQKLFKADVRFFVRRIGHRADHDERRVQLVAGLRNRRRFHFHRFDFGEVAANFRHAFAAVDKAVAADNQALRYRRAFKYFRRLFCLADQEVV